MGSCWRREGAAKHTNDSSSREGVTIGPSVEMTFIAAVAVLKCEKQEAAYSRSRVLRTQSPAAEPQVLSRFLRSSTAEAEVLSDRTSTHLLTRTM